MNREIIKNRKEDAPCLSNEEYISRSELFVGTFELLEEELAEIIGGSDPCSNGSLCDVPQTEGPGC